MIYFLKMLARSFLKTHKKFYKTLKISKFCVEVCLTILLEKKKRFSLKILYHPKFDIK